MIDQPNLETQRLRLRPLELKDARLIHEAAGSRDIADTMISIPHPYPEGEAEQYVTRQLSERKTGDAVTFIIQGKTNGSFYGFMDS